jgi:nucleoside-diphosphate-sugar epimerase
MISEVFLKDLEQIVQSPHIPWGDLKDASFLITGGTGLIGSGLIRALALANETLSLNMSIICHGRSEVKAKALTEEGGTRFIISDICEPIPAETISERIDYIIHCAAVTKSAEMAARPVDVMDISVKGTRNILELARLKKVKSILYLSSMEVYGQTDKAEATESDLGYIDLSNPRSSYPESKRFCESLCAGYYTQYGVPTKIARLAQTFGAGTPKDDTRVFAQFARSALEGKDIILHTKGRSRGNYCYTADTLMAILTILLKGENGNAYNVSNPETSVTIREMADMVAVDICRDKIKVRMEIPPDAASFGYAPDAGYRLNIDKLRKLGWKPQVGLKDMYRRLLTDWQAIGDS